MSHQPNLVDKLCKGLAK